MVREANVKQANAEKQLKEALGKVSTHHSTPDQTVYQLTLRISVSFFRSTSSRRRFRL